MFFTRLKDFEAGIFIFTGRRHGNWVGARAEAKFWIGACAEAKLNVISIKIQNM